MSGPALRPLRPPPPRAPPPPPAARPPRPSGRPPAPRPAGSAPARAPRPPPPPPRARPRRVSCGPARRAVAPPTPAPSAGLQPAGVKAETGDPLRAPLGPRCRPGVGRWRGRGNPPGGFSERGALELLGRRGCANPARSPRARPRGRRGEGGSRGPVGAHADPGAASPGAKPRPGAQSSRGSERRGWRPSSTAICRVNLR